MEEAERERNEELLRQALLTAARQKLPFTARSLTQKEYAAASRRQLGWLLGGGALFLIVLPFTFLFSGSDDPHVDDALELETVMAIVPYASGLALLLLLALPVVMWRAGKGYVDPRSRVEVWDEGVTITSPGHRHTLAFADVAPVLRGQRPGSSRFMGITLASPNGPIELDDLRFKGGRKAAASIAGRCVAAGALAAPEQQASKRPTGPRHAAHLATPKRDERPRRAEKGARQAGRLSLRNNPWF